MPRITTIKGAARGRQAPCSCVTAASDSAVLQEEIEAVSLKQVSGATTGERGPRPLYDRAARWPALSRLGTLRSQHRHASRLRANTRRLPRTRNSHVRNLTRRLWPRSTANGLAIANTPRTGETATLWWICGTLAIKVGRRLPMCFSVRCRPPVGAARRGIRQTTRCRRRGS